MPRNPIAGGLLEVASMLADTRDPRRSVEEAAFRRALSTAYYALFHELCHLCGHALGYWTGDPADLALIYRGIEHGRVGQVLASAEGRSLHPDLGPFAEAFGLLRRWREDADYSQPGRFGAVQRLLTRAEVRTQMEVASEAIGLREALPEPVRRRLALMMTVAARRR